MGASGAGPTTTTIGVGVGVGLGIGVAVRVPVIVGVGVGVAVRVPVIVGVGVATRPHTETLLPSSVTAPVRARALPETLAPVFRVTLASARIFPGKKEVVPRIAELPTCHHTLQARAPLIRRTDEPLAVVSVLPILKM